MKQQLELEAEGLMQLSLQRLPPATLRIQSFRMVCGADERAYAGS